MRFPRLTRACMRAQKIRGVRMRVQKIRGVRMHVQKFRGVRVQKFRGERMRVQKIRGVHMHVQKFTEECMRVLFIRMHMCVLRKTLCMHDLFSRVCKLVVLHLIIWACVET